MQGFALFCLVLLLTLCSRVEAQEVTINGLHAEGVQSNLAITTDIIEYRQGDDPAVHITTGKKHYGLSLVSPMPIPMFDTQFPVSSAELLRFTIQVEDGRKFSRCVVTGLKSSGTDPSHQLTYSFVCEDVSTPPMPCTNCN